MDKATMEDTQKFVNAAQVKFFSYLYSLFRANTGVQARIFY